MMNSLQNTLAGICARYPEIVFAYIFGSQATGEQTPMSDVDIAIYLKNPSAFDFNKLLLFHGDCCRALKRNDIDVLVLNTAKNLMLIEEIIRNGTLMYNTDQDLVDDFEIRLLHAICDFKERKSWELFN